MQAYKVIKGSAIIIQCDGDFTGSLKSFTHWDGTRQLAEDSSHKYFSEKRNAVRYAMDCIKNKIAMEEKRHEYFMTSCKKDFETLEATYEIL